mmetsp:Transcript_25078/g.73435  ORF Transcript_25078/g.73435 Transcript_25078/m.73435 type:complete len:248 (-) Transcript_25078:163-906(-)
MVGGDYVLRSWHKIFSGILAASQWYKFKDVRKYSNIAESQVMIHRRHVCCIGSQQGRDFAVVYGRTVRNPRPPPRPDLALHMAHEGLAITARTVQKGGQTFRIHAKAGLLGVWVRAREADVLPQQIVNRLNSSLVALSHKKDDAAALGEGARGSHPAGIFEPFHYIRRSNEYVGFDGKGHVPDRESSLIQRCDERTWGRGRIKNVSNRGIRTEECTARHLQSHVMVPVRKDNQSSIAQITVQIKDIV